MITCIAVGGSHVLVLLDTGELLAWGSNQYGQLGNGSTKDSQEPLSVPLEDVVAIAAGEFHSMAVNDDGDLFCWGCNSSGQLGDGTMSHCATPKIIMEYIDTISAGGGHSLALQKPPPKGLKRQNLFAWGMDVCEDGSSRSAIVHVALVQKPVKIWEDFDGGKAVVAMCCGRNHSLIVLEDGACLSWGRNGHGQLGDGTTRDRLTPEKVVEEIQAVSSGLDFSLAITRTGDCLAWGCNGSGRLGTGDTVDRLLPTRILQDVKAACAGAYHGAALLSSGDCFGWGSNLHHCIASELEEEVLRPAKLFDGVRQLALGTHQSFALMGSGALHFWGHQSGEHWESIHLCQTWPERRRSVQAEKAVACEEKINFEDWEERWRILANMLLELLTGLELRKMWLGRKEAEEQLAQSIQASLQGKAGVSMEARLRLAELNGKSEVLQIRHFMEALERQWNEKGCTLLQELCANLREPSGDDEGSEPLGLRRLAAVCEQIQKKYGEKKLHPKLQHHLLCTSNWVLYTMQDADIDRLFGFDVETLPEGMEEPAERDDYYSTYRARDDVKGKRNPQMFQVANKAARVCYDTGADDSSQEGKEALDGVRTWVKWLCFLGASAKELPAPGVDVTRGLCGLPPHLMEDFRDIKKGEFIFWAAPSSMTDDPSVSESYCNQREPKNQNVLFIVNGVSCAVPMFELSAYPDEREWLMPPFSMLEVVKIYEVPDGDPIKLECKFLGCMIEGGLKKRVLADFFKSSQQLEAVLEGMQKERKAWQKQLDRDLLAEVRDKHVVQYKPLDALPVPILRRPKIAEAAEIKPEAKKRVRRNLGAQPKLTHDWADGSPAETFGQFGERKCAQMMELLHKKARQKNRAYSLRWVAFRRDAEDGELDPDAPQDEVLRAFHEELALLVVRFQGDRSRLEDMSKGGWSPDEIHPATGVLAMAAALEAAVKEVLACMPPPKGSAEAGK